MQVRLERHLAAIEGAGVQRKEHVGFAEAGNYLEGVASKRLHVAVQRLGNPVDSRMHVDAAIRQPARHLFARPECRRRQGSAREAERQPSIESSIGNRHDIHAARLRGPIDVHGDE